MIGPSPRHAIFAATSVLLLLLAFWWSAGSETETDTLRIFEPSPGFVLSYDHYEAVHLGPSRIPSALGGLVEVEAVRESYQFDGNRFEAYLFLSKDFRDVVAGHAAQCRVDPNCPGEMFIWPSPGETWFFGLSGSFGSRVQTVPWSDVPSGLRQEFRECDAILDLRREAAGRTRPSPTWSSIGGIMCLDTLGRPIKIAAMDDLYDHKGSEDPVTEEAPVGAVMRATPNPVPSNEFPLESGRGYSGFPWSEAFSHARSEIMSTERIISFTHHLEDMRSYSPLLGNATLSQSWSWGIDLDRPQGAPRSLVVSKEQIAASEPKYAVSAGGQSSGVDLDRFQDHNTTVPVDRFIGYVRDLLGSEIVTVQALSQSHGGVHLGRQYVATPNLSEAGGGTVQVHVSNVVMDAHTGELVQLALPPDMLKRIVYERPPVGN